MRREGGVPWHVRVGSRGVFTFEARSARATPAGEADTAVLVDGSAARAPLVLLERVIAAPQRIAGGGKPDQARLRTDAHGCTWTHLWAEAHAARRQRVAWRAHAS